METLSTQAPSSVEEIIGAVRDLRARSARLPSEREMAQALNVKRHQLRKALDALRKTGDLQPAQPRRRLLAEPHFGEELVRMTNPLEVLELRLVMEPGFARLASVRASGLDIQRIAEAATTPQDASSGEVDLAFHFAIANATRNHLALEFYRMLRQVGVDARVRIAGATAPACPKRVAQRDAEHRAIAEAIARRNPEAAEAAMRAHLLAVQRQINERMSPGVAA